MNIYQTIMLYNYDYFCLFRNIDKAILEKLVGAYPKNIRRYAVLHYILISIGK